ncbi:hypothetical protein [Cryptosporangium minutisporangium]|uniref:Uncharacterized protein n=1 Tax=Cryptosporangium minutisporangium TaxID=113569 RepID=A0ABP6SWA5_9ACTN
MPTVNQAEALRLMRRLTTAASSRLHGVHLDHGAYSYYPAPGAPYPDWPDDYNTAVEYRAAGQQIGSTPIYTVFSDRFPVCWLTYDGQIVESSAALTRLQARHRRLAVAALGELTRLALRQLADLRDVRDGRPKDIDGYDSEQRTGQARVSHPTAPARAWWIAVGPDLEHARSRSREVTGTPEPLILSAHGYGRYGRDAECLPLELLCAINATVAAHQDTTTLTGERAVNGNVVGDWLADEHGLSGALPADQIPAAFAAAFLGVYSHDQDFAAERMRQNGWDQALRDLGALEFFDLRQYTYQLFRREVRAIPYRTARDSGIIVCRRES